MKILRISGIVLRCLGFLLFAGFFKDFIIQALTGYQITSLSTLNLIPYGPEKYLVAQGLAFLLALIGLPLIYIYFMKPDLKRMFRGMNGVNTTKVIGFSLLILLCSMPLIAALMEWNQSLWFPEGMAKWVKDLEKLGKETTEIMVYQPSALGLLLAIVVVGIIPGIAEEFLFRGVVQAELKEEKMNMHTVIWITAIIFSAVHMQFYGFFPRLLLGAMMGYIAWWTNSLTAPMIFHCLNNTITVIAYNLHKYKNIGPAPDKNEFAWYSVLVSVVLTGVMIYFFRRSFVKPEAKAEI